MKAKLVKESIINEGHANTGWQLESTNPESAKKEIMDKAKEARNYGDGDLQKCWKASYVGKMDYDRADRMAERNEGTAIIFEENGKFYFTLWFRT